jgi:hypothetical protein
MSPTCARRSAKWGAKFLAVPVAIAMIAAKMSTNATILSFLTVVKFLLSQPARERRLSSQLRKWLDMGTGYEALAE